MRFPAYPNYKSSGVEWLGEVPEHWGAIPLKYLAEFVNGMAFKPDTWSTEGVSIIRIENLNGGADFNCFKGGVPIKYHVNEGELLFGWSGNRGTSFGPFLWGREGLYYLNQHIFKLTGFTCDKAWFYWCLKAVTRTIEGEAHGIIGMVHVTRGKLGAVPIPSVPPTEQRAIADFLDRETAKIDMLVAKKRTLIERLKEKRTALISRTVTRGLPAANARQAGLDPHPKLKSSGIDWLRDVPEHWEITRVRHCFQNLDYRRFPVSGEDRSSLEKIYPYYGASGIIDYVDEYLFDETLILVAEDGANLLSRSTPLAFLATGKYWVNNHAHILKPVFGDIRYWLGVLQAYDYTPLVTGAAQPKLTSERLGSIALPQPPSGEQRVIANFLDRETAKIDALIAKVEIAIERLQEYRTALITAAVTGKIDVRSGAMPRENAT